MSTLARGDGWFESEIKVSQEHMIKGIPGDPSNCPIALAIKEQIRGLVDVIVGPDIIRIHLRQSGPWWADLPRLKWLRLYDRGIMTKPEPFTIFWTEWLDD